MPKKKGDAATRSDGECCELSLSVDARETLKFVFKQYGRELEEKYTASREALRRLRKPLCFGVLAYLDRRLELREEKAVLEHRWKEFIAAQRSVLESEAPYSSWATLPY